jgi:hypothetical protein
MLFPVNIFFRQHRPDFETAWRIPEMVKLDHYTRSCISLSRRRASFLTILSKGNAPETDRTLKPIQHVPSK